MNDSPVKIDALLEPLLAEASDAQVDQLLSQLITEHAEPVIKGVIRFKLRLNSYRETQRAEAEVIHQEVVLQLLYLPPTASANVPGETSCVEK